VATIKELIVIIEAPHRTGMDFIVLAEEISDGVKGADVVDGFTIFGAKMFLICENFLNIS
jgi:hypothetical protein